MFGMGIGEILLIGVVAILFLGPDKLPTAMVEVAKFFKAFKKTLQDAKDTIDKEVHISDIKEEAEKYKRSIEDHTEDLVGNFSIDELEKKQKNSKPEPKEERSEEKNQDKEKSSGAKSEDA